MTRCPRGLFAVWLLLLASLALVQPASAQTTISNYVYGMDDPDAGHNFFQEQEADRWCWAATALMIMAFHGQPQWLQCIQADDAHPQADDAHPERPIPHSCCDERANERPLCNRTGWPQFGHYGFTSERTADYVPLTFSEVVEQIDNHLPIAVALQWSTGGGHMGAVVGYQIDDKNQPWVLLIDPDGFHGAVLLRYEIVFGVTSDGPYKYWRSYYNIKKR